MERWRRGLKLEAWMHACHHSALHLSSNLELDFTLQLGIQLALVTWQCMRTKSACTCHACMQHATRHACNMQHATCNMQHATCDMQQKLDNFDFDLDMQFWLLQLNLDIQLDSLHGNSNLFMVDYVICVNALNQYIYIICNIRKIVCF